MLKTVFFILSLLVTSSKTYPQDNNIHNAGNIERSEFSLIPIPDFDKLINALGQKVPVRIFIKKGCNFIMIMPILFKVIFVYVTSEVSQKVLITSLESF